MQLSPKIKDLTGLKFERFLVISFAGLDKRKHATWKCICDCGKIVVVKSGNLISGNSYSCGCYRDQKAGEQSLIHGHTKRINGKQVPSPEYVCWLNIKSRCGDPKNKSYKDYGGRGIVVCGEWQSFSVFLADMGLKPSPQHSIERDDTNGNYEKSNCYWATKDIQVRNKRNNHWIEHNGIKLTISDWARKFGAFEENLRRMMKKKTFSECENYYLYNKRKPPSKK